MKEKKIRKRTVRTVAALALTAVIAISTVACSSTNAATKSDGNLKPVTIALAPSSPRPALTILADKLGYYKDEGVEVNLVYLDQVGDIISSMETGKVDQSALAITPYLTSIANGSDFTIYGGTAYEGESLLTKAENVDYYKDLSHLAGKKIATVRSSTGEILTRAHLKAAGVDIENGYELVEFTSYPAIVEAIASGNVDAGYVINELLDSAQSRGLGQVYNIGQLEPQYVCCRQTVKTSSLTENREAYVRVLKANLRAYKFWKENQDETVKILAEYTGQTEDYIRNIVYNINATFTVDPNKNSVVKYYNLLKEYKYINSDVKIEDHIDTTVYKDALTQTIEENPNDEIYKQLWTDYEKNDL
ncbi:ABC transporter substrate-binding protein [Acetobacterium tundrae]|uniref:Transporter substrate-binding domain-containing protein n=1 Tax=Acetobacterium tundrae TaxID=132932 RepID=A0ABR6WHC2_9FIRM|nr:ABC transporter substrate-binding protein [Acetobacterium tundrae]MBC3795626.1 transporter substrate-binding domain-containing protein [Acetobacterium tundrae]